ncbi:MAG TPA: hypothetical protein VFW07_07130 [Parafilimonas sp.]|nr:hypothetical protein [Parafilimonas sp.]
MLVIISDLHLTDGTSGEIISDSAFRLFRNRLSDMAYDASWRCDENGIISYQPVEEISIILLGDILDMIRSEKWNTALEKIMPWTKPREDEFFSVVENIVTGILKFNATSFAILRGLSREGDLKIPGSMKLAGDEKQAREKITYEAGESIPVKVNIYYMIGNHDWFFNIADPRMINIRKQVIDALGLANAYDAPFPYHRDDCDAVKAVQDAHNVFAEHGDMYDPTNFQTPNRDASSVGDVVVIKLLNKIPGRIGEYLYKYSAGAPEEIEKFVKKLREIDNLRPYALAAAWIAQVIKETNLPGDVINKAINLTLKELITEFTNNELVSKKELLRINMLLVRLIFVWNLHISVLGNLINHTPFSKDKLQSYRKFAISMARNQDKDFFVMGHTHYAEIVPLSVYKKDEAIRSKIYINTGTWRTVHLQSLVGKDFVSYKTLALAGFFKENERRGRPFEFWTGSLAL